MRPKDPRAPAHAAVLPVSSPYRPADRHGRGGICDLCGERVCPLAGKVLVRKRNASPVGLREDFSMFRFLLILSLAALGACESGPPAGSDAVSVHVLAQQGDTGSLLAEVVSTGNLDPRDACYRTPLMFAAQFGRLDTVSELIAAGARVNFA